MSVLSPQQQSHQEPRQQHEGVVGAVAGGLAVHVAAAGVAAGGTPDVRHAPLAPWVTLAGAASRKLRQLSAGLESLHLHTVLLSLHVHLWTIRVVPWIVVCVEVCGSGVCVCVLSLIHI